MCGRLLPPVPVAVLPRHGASCARCRHNCPAAAGNAAVAEPGGGRVATRVSPATIVMHGRSLARPAYNAVNVNQSKSIKERRLGYRTLLSPIKYLRNQVLLALITNRII
jgi:hypothetical protein